VKVKGLTDREGGPTLMYIFWCPACEKPHPYRTARAETEGPNYPVWGFNGDREKPTFTPSLLVHPTPPNPDGSVYQVRCHLFLTDGKIQYCSDSQHRLAGQTVECPDWDDERW
jgi:hypothetical protein